MRRPTPDPTAVTTPTAVTAGHHRRPGSRLSALAALTAAALVLAACGGSDDGDDGAQGAHGQSADTVAVDADNCPADALDDAEGPTEITVWHPYNALTQTTLEEAATSYNASQDRVRVRVEAQGTYPELLKKYEERLSTPQDLPDVIFSEDTTLQFMVDSGSVIAAADCVAADPDSAEFYDALLEPVRTAYTAQGKLWAAAYGVSMPIMYINNDHLEAAGLGADDHPGTLDELRSVAERIAAADIEGLDAPLVMQLYGWYPENWLTGAGEQIVDRDNGRSGVATESLVDSEATAEIVEWMDQMQADGLLKAFPYSSDISQFLAIGGGTASILIDGSRAITAVDAVVGGQQVEGIDGVDTEALAGLDVTVAPVPGLDGPGQGAVWGSAAFLVDGEDEARVAAGWDFLQYFNSVPVQTDWLTKGSYLPVATTVQDAPAVEEYFASSRAGQWLGTVNDQLSAVDADLPGPAIGPYNEFRDLIHSMLDDVVLGSVEPADAIADFDAAFQADLDSYRADVGG